MPVIQTHNLTKIHQNRLIAVNGVDLTVEPGMIFGLLGPNGAGKTTIIKMLLGLMIPTAGRAEVFGQSMSPNAAHLRQRIGYLPTNPKFPPLMTPITYLDFIGQLYGLQDDVRKPLLASLIRAVGLLSAQSQQIKSFSTGMTTRLGIAASLINDADVLIWDEPTSGLDPVGRKYTLDLIRELGRTKTIIVSSHILSDIDRVCDNVGILYEGKLIYQGPMNHFKKSIGRNSVEIEMDGDTQAIDDLCNRMRLMPEIAEFQRRNTWWEVHFLPTDSLAASLGRLLIAASEIGMDVLNVNSTGGQAEEAFMHMLEVDKANGFSRILDKPETAIPELPPLPDGVERSLTSGLDYTE
ncbi:MAG: ABC transporter ATP-binding protein [Armatimonadota bacterium]